MAREAGVNKTLIYRYFGDLSGVLREYAGGLDFWPDLYEVISGEPTLGPNNRYIYHTLESLPADLLQSLNLLHPAERVSRVIINLAEAIRRRPTTIELMALESTECNELTTFLDTIREERGQELIKLLPKIPASLENQFVHADQLQNTILIGSMLTGALFYFMIRRRNTPFFGGIDIQSHDGWEAMYKAVRECSQILFATKSQTEYPTQ